MSKNNSFFELNERDGFEGGYKEKGPLGTLVGRLGRVTFSPAERLETAQIAWPLLRIADAQTPFGLSVPSERELPYAPRVWVRGKFSLTVALSEKEKEERARNPRHTHEELERAGFAAVFSMRLEPIRLAHNQFAYFGDRVHDSFLTAAFTAEEWERLSTWINQHLPVNP